MSPGGETSHEIARYYRNRLDDILGRQLTPENFDGYAATALDDLIALIQDAVQASEYDASLGNLSGLERETVAFDKYGLLNVEAVLDHISGLSDEIGAITAFMEQVPVSEKVIIPTSRPNHAPLEAPGRNRLQEKRIIHRVETILLLLDRSFDLAISDPDVVRVERGITTHGMMRQESYFSIDIPALNRLILACNEEDNVTYIFDQARLSNLDIPIDQLEQLTKQDLDDLLERNSTVGRRISYSSRFVEYVISALQSDIEAPARRNYEGAGSRYLYPKAPEGFLSKHAMAKLWEISDRPIQGAIDELGESLGPVNEYREGVCYSPSQQKLIYDYVDAKGTFAEQVLPGYAAFSALAGAWGVAQGTVERAVRALDAKGILGERVIMKHHSTVTEFFSPGQQWILNDYLKMRGRFLPPVPEGFLSVSGMASKLHIDKRTLRRILSENADFIGKPETYKTNNGTVDCYSPEQQERIQSLRRRKRPARD